MRDAYLQLRQKAIEENRIPYSKYVKQYYSGGLDTTDTSAHSDDTTGQSNTADSGTAGQGFVEIDGS